MQKYLKLVGSLDSLKLILDDIDNLMYNISEQNNDITVSLDNINEFEFENILEVLQDKIYADELVSLQKTLVDLLLDYKLSFASAESCTGGMIASSIIDIPGSSQVFFEGLVTYSNQSKINRLGVLGDTLTHYGAVSEEVVAEMLDGLLLNGASIAVATSGIAGPDGGSIEKPVGLVYIGVSSMIDGQNYQDIQQYIFKGDRNTIRKKATNTAIFNIIQYIKNYY